MYVLLTGGGGLVLGGLCGLLIGVMVPGYYRAVFGVQDEPSFDPVLTGVVLGSTQGLFAGFVIGLIILLIYVWYLTRLNRRVV